MLKHHTHKIPKSFEATKIDDIIEVINHFIAVQFMVDVVIAPLPQTMIKKFHQLPTYGTHSDWPRKPGCGEYRTGVYNLGVTPDQISSSLS